MCMLIIKKDILILGEGPTQNSDGTTLITEKKYALNFTEHHTKFCLNLRYNGVNSYLFVNGVEINKFKVNHSEINPVTLCLRQCFKRFCS